MKKTPPTVATVDDYIAAQPEPLPGILTRVRRAIRKGAPEAEECISYKIPAYKLNGKPVLYFAVWKQHYALYPVGDRLAEFQTELAPYKLSKGTVRFPIAEPVPVKLIERIARFRAEHITTLPSAASRSAKRS